MYKHEQLTLYLVTFLSLLLLAGGILLIRSKKSLPSPVETTSIQEINQENQTGLVAGITDKAAETLPSMSTSINRIETVGQISLIYINLSITNNDDVELQFNPLLDIFAVSDNKTYTVNYEKSTLKAGPISAGTGVNGVAVIETPAIIQNSISLFYQPNSSDATIEVNLSR